MVTETPIVALERAVKTVEDAQNRMHPYVVVGNTTVTDARAALEDVEELRKAARAVVALFINARGGCWDVVTIRENSEHHHNLRDAVAKFTVKS